MQTRRKAVRESTSNNTRLTRNNATRENSANNLRSPRALKKTATLSEKKVADLITSSAKKQKSVRVLPKKNGLDKEGKNLCTTLSTAGSGVCTVKPASVDYKKSEEISDDCNRETIFSPSFHHHKENGGIFHEEGNLIYLQIDEKMEEVKQDSNEQCMVSDAVMSHADEDEFSGLGNLSSEVSAIYLAMQQNNSNKLECVEEHSQDSISSDECCAEAEEAEDYDDFDPYVFIKDLPDLSMVVPKFRPVLLPKQTRSCPSTTLVLDLDETLVHSTLEPCQDADFSFLVNFNLKEHTIYVKCRPYLRDFLERVASLFETIIFTASQSIYAEQLLNVLDPKRKLFRHRVYRDSCVFVEGNYLKDLSVLGRDLSRVIIVDNSPQAFGFQIDNGVPIESWFDDPNDRELLSLLPFLESLAGVEDVRPLITQKFNLREKVAAATSLSIDFRSMFQGETM
ncbi:hypothetical protein LUZ63_004439 [Rhynchospora breviuscula]|uniref:FCP1 homology domain-containing protein n=1 Tax=Rhynchospora breviuscula TaxID=2022672 RepID=A0A9Q0D3R7_9POAL|nr:hypothetical protein LUZ63_004439 [Rhynchospora breviuscula]